jgi:hypothetical protein
MWLHRSYIRSDASLGDPQANLSALFLSLLSGGRSFEDEPVCGDLGFAPACFKKLAEALAEVEAACERPHVVILVQDHVNALLGGTTNQTGSALSCCDSLAFRIKDHVEQCEAFTDFSGQVLERRQVFLVSD